MNSIDKLIEKLNKEKAQDRFKEFKSFTRY